MDVKILHGQYGVAVSQVNGHWLNETLHCVLKMQIKLGIGIYT